MTPRSRLLFASALLSGLLAFPADSEAQFTWPATWIQASTGFSGGLGEWKDDADGAISWSGMIAVAYRPSLQLSLGYARHGFDCRGGLTCDLEANNWTASGIRAQIEYRFADLNGLRPWVRGGVSNNKLHLSTSPSYNSDRAFGILGGAGFEVDLGGTASVSIGARGEQFGSQLPEGTDVDVRFWVVDFGFRFRVH